MTGAIRRTDYRYNAFNNLREIDPSPSGAGGDELLYDWDEFERLTGARGPAGPPIGSTYAYDALDRRDSRREDNKVYDYSYVGATEQLSREDVPGATEGRYYDYDSGLERIGQATKAGSGAVTYRSYASDANGSVEGLEDAQGAVAADAAYAYDPYGELLSSAPAGSPAAGNPFRFQGHHYDQVVKTYDMRARHYRPDLQRFLSEDRFQSAGQDLSLQLDPLTHNRYVFLGGNPVDQAEFDGHIGEHAADLNNEKLRKKGKRPSSRPERRGEIGTAGTRAYSDTRSRPTSGSPTRSQPVPRLGSGTAANSPRRGLSPWQRQHARCVDDLGCGTVSAPDTRPGPVGRQLENVADRIGNRLLGGAEGLFGFYLLGERDSRQYKIGKERAESPAVQVLSTVPAGGLGAVSKLDDAARLGSGAAKGAQGVDQGFAVGAGFRSFSQAKRVLGPAGEGKQWHHLVEQTPGNVGRFGSEAIHNTGNLVRLDTAIHRQVSGYFSSKQPFTGGQTVRQWLSGQSYARQQKFSRQVMQRFGG